jgi:hypothetical protein
MNNNKRLGVGLIVLSVGLSFIFGITIPTYWILGFSALIAIILNMPSLRMYFALFYVNIRYGFKPPDKDTYKCKVDYILPFKGKWTVQDGGVTKELSHSWEAISQRYAYDFIIVDLEHFRDTGYWYPGNPEDLYSYTCYGKDIIAVADGVVVKICNRHPDRQVTGKEILSDSWDIRGNFVIIKHAENEYSLCCHLAKDSITVKVGDNVKQGEVIAKCGNSGITNEPQLHFQLQTNKSFFFSAGLPIAFSNIKIEQKNLYNLMDERSCKDNELHLENNKVCIGRGLEVENISSFTYL